MSKGEVLMVLDLVEPEEVNRPLVVQLKYLPLHKLTHTSLMMQAHTVTFGLPTAEGGP